MARQQNLQRERASIEAAALMVFACTFNAFLALINAHVARLNTSHVLLSEVIIIGLSCFSIAKNSHISGKKIDYPTVFFFLFFVIVFGITGLAGQLPSPKFLRDMLIIPIFYLLGRNITSKTLITTVQVLTITVLITMIIEGWFTNSYVALLQPSSYYTNTRGVQELAGDSSGLFRNSLGFAGRFSFGIFNTHRLSSIFLEQVSLANFSMILGIFTITLWESSSSKQRLLFVGTIVLILLTNNTRTGAVFALIALVGFYIFPALPSMTSIIYMPSVLALGALLYSFSSFNPNILSDTIQGRIGLTMFRLGELDLKSIFMGNLSLANNMQDSGYLYLIYSQTLFGLIYFWLFTSSIASGSSNSAKRFSNATSVFIAFNLLIGAGIFTIKTSAILWVVAGFVAQSSSAKEDGSRAWP